MMNRISHFGRILAYYGVVNTRGLVASPSKTYLVGTDSGFGVPNSPSFRPNAAVCCSIETRPLPFLGASIMNGFQRAFARLSAISPLLLAPRLIGWAIFFTPLKSVSEPFDV
jgi:hypothetical protein